MPFVFLWLMALWSGLSREFAEIVKYRSFTEWSYKYKTFFIILILIKSLPFLYDNQPPKLLFRKNDWFWMVGVITRSSYNKLIVYSSNFNFNLSFCIHLHSSTLCTNLTARLFFHFHFHPSFLLCLILNTKPRLVTTCIQQVCAIGFQACQGIFSVLCQENSFRPVRKLLLSIYYRASWSLLQDTSYTWNVTRWRPEYQANSL